MAPDSRSRPDNLAEIDHLARALAKDPQSKAFMPLAEEYGKAGMWQEAAAVLEDGLKLYPGFVTAMVALGRAYDQLNQPAKARTVLEDAVKASPENLRAHRTLAKIYTAQGAAEAARKSCAVVLAANPTDQEALALRATLDAAAAAAAAAAATPPPPSPIQAEPTAETAPSPESDQHGPESSAQTAQPAAGPDNSMIDRLEGWLTSIRAKRRDQTASGESEKPTS